MVFEVREAGKSYASGGLVIDNSVAMRWLVASGKTSDQRYALRVRNHVRDKQAEVLVPYLWTYEASNVAAYYVGADELPYNQAFRALQALSDVVTIRIDRGETPHALFEAADRYRITSYDAAYLLLARAEGLPLATLDKKMRKVARSLGVPIFESA